MVEEKGVEENGFKKEGGVKKQGIVEILKNTKSTPVACTESNTPGLPSGFAGGVACSELLVQLMMVAQCDQWLAIGLVFHGGSKMDMAFE
ncbi:hypothetical protein E2542_SST07497 [Spatholobus suberectus]|nr:hypothetical protein E2542_SST07497 [Spatholobus suberectus]